VPSKQRTAPARSAPKDGYDFEAKAQYRQDLWESVRDELGPLLWSDAHVGILPSSEGLEIDTLVRLGMSPDRIHAFDKSAAILATAKWRKKYPDVRVYAGEVSRSIERVREAGLKLRALNLDLCGGFTSPMVETVMGCVRSNAIHDAAVVAVTAMKGRESQAFFAALGMQEQPTRADALLSVCDDRRFCDGSWVEASTVADVFHRGSYKSSRVVMEYAVARVTKVKARQQEMTAYQTAEYMLSYTATKAESMLYWYNASNSAKAKQLGRRRLNGDLYDGDLTQEDHLLRMACLKDLCDQFFAASATSYAQNIEESPESLPLCQWFSLGSNRIGQYTHSELFAQVKSRDANAREKVPFWDREVDFVHHKQRVMHVLGTAHDKMLRDNRLPRLNFSKSFEYLLL